MENLYKNDFVNNDYLPLSVNFWKTQIKDISWSEMLKNQESPKSRLCLSKSREFLVFTKIHKALPFSRRDIFYVSDVKDVINLKFLDNSYEESITINIMDLGHIAGIKTTTMYNVYLDFPSALHAIEFVKIILILEEKFWIKAHKKWIHSSSIKKVSEFMEAFCKKYSEELVSKGWFLYEHAVLYFVLKNKFNNFKLCELLSKTTNKQLLCINEINNYKPNYVENTLGQIIMFIRQEQIKS